MALPSLQRAPSLRGWPMGPAMARAPRAIILVEVMALILPVLVAMTGRDGSWIVLLVTAFLATVLWQALFALVRKRPMPLDAPITAALVALALPATTPLWQVVLAISFGIVAAEQIFGGRGYAFLNTAVAALAFLLFSFPGTGLASFGLFDGLAAIIGGVVLIGARITAWQTLAGAVIGIAVVLAAGAPLADLATLAWPSLVFGTVFLAADPAASSVTRPGRWISGFVFGALTVLLAGTNPPGAIEPVIFAALLASVLAPLIDEGVIAVHVWRREPQHG